MALNKADLYQMYIVERMSIPMVAEIIGKSKSTTRWILLRAGIELRTPTEGRLDAFRLGRVKKCSKTRHPMSEETKARLSASRLRWAEKNASGVTIKPNGYVEYTRGENKGRLVHIVTMEKHIGRRLLPNEVVHHINKDRKDNRIENLQLMTRSEHCRLHTLERHNKQL